MRCLSHISNEPSRAHRLSRLAPVNYVFNGLNGMTQKRFAVHTIDHDDKGQNRQKPLCLGCASAAATDDKLGMEETKLPTWPTLITNLCQVLVQADACRFQKDYAASRRSSMANEVCIHKPTLLESGTSFCQLQSLRGGSSKGTLQHPDAAGDTGSTCGRRKTHKAATRTRWKGK